MIGGKRTLTGVASTFGLPRDFLALAIANVYFLALVIADRDEGGNPHPGPNLNPERLFRMSTAPDILTQAVNRLNEARAEYSSVWSDLIRENREAARAADLAGSEGEGLAASLTRLDAAKAALERATAPTVGAMLDKAELLLGATHGVTADLRRHLFTGR